MRWFLYLPVSLAFTLTAFLLWPILPLFANDKGWLPWWLNWYQTPDWSLDGDEKWRAERSPFKGQQTGIKRYINRALWLFRNPAYSFDWLVLSYRKQPNDILKVRGTIDLERKTSGWYFATCGYAWNLYIGVHLTSKHKTKINLGWKLFDLNRADGLPCQFVFSPGIWKTI